MRSADALVLVLDWVKRSHACCADLNTGDWTLMSLGITSPPVALGSGKFETPCARMHCASLSSGPLRPPASVGWCEDPQAAIPAAHAIKASVAYRRGERVTRAVRGGVVDGLRIVVMSYSRGGVQFYEPGGDSAGTATVTDVLPAVRDAPD